MKRTFTLTGLINGQNTNVETTITITDEELEQLVQKKVNSFADKIGLTIDSSNTKKESQYKPYSKAEATPSEDTEDTEEDYNEFYEEYEDEPRSFPEPVSEVKDSDNTTYTPYSGSAKSPEKDSYTPYASVKKSETNKNFPKSYHPAIKNEYAPYNTFRVVVPEGWVPAGLKE